MLRSSVHDLAEGSPVVTFNAGQPGSANVEVTVTKAGAEGGASFELLKNPL